MLVYFKLRLVCFTNGRMCFKYTCTHRTGIYTCIHIRIYTLNPININQIIYIYMRRNLLQAPVVEKLDEIAEANALRASLGLKPLRP